VTGSDDLLELVLMVDALKDAGAGQVHAVTPYLAYMRQDKRFKEGEALSAKTVLKMLAEFADMPVTVNCHFLNEAGENVFEGVRFMNLDAVPLLVDYFKSKTRSPVVIAPDKGSMGYARMAAELLDCEFNHLDKARISGEEVLVKDKELDLKGKDVIILDDIISTGGTIVNACKVIRGGRPASGNVGCVHGLFLKGVDQFQGVVDRIVACNSLKSSVSKVSVATLIADYLKG
jgi:ribose-phosphate pyrophosphokinase